LLREAFRTVRAQRPFTIDAIVILPDHLHTLWTLPDGDTDYSGRWRAIQSGFTHRLLPSGIPLVRVHRGEYHLWQRRFWEHTIRDDAVFQHLVDYILWNPVKHGLTRHVADCHYSSFHDYLRLGFRPNGWSSRVHESDGGVGLHR